jgi:hypothetical protein
VTASDAANRCALPPSPHSPTHACAVGTTCRAALGLEALGAITVNGQELNRGEVARTLTPGAYDPW